MRVGGDGMGRNCGLWAIARTAITAVGLWLLGGTPRPNRRSIGPCSRNTVPRPTHRTWLAATRSTARMCLELAVLDHPELSGQRPIAVDGRIDLADFGRIRIEGRSVPDVAQCIAEVAQVPPERVRVRVADYRSQEIFLFGQVAGLQCAVAYRGPETVLELLQCAGGITSGAAPDDVYVIRSHMAEARRPEVFHVDLLRHRHEARRPHQMVAWPPSTRCMSGKIAAPPWKSASRPACSHSTRSSAVSIDRPPTHLDSPSVRQLPTAKQACMPRCGAGRPRDMAGAFRSNEAAVRAASGAAN